MTAPDPESCLPMRHRVRAVVARHHRAPSSRIRHLSDRRRHLTQILAAITLCASIVAVGARLGGTASARPFSDSSGYPAHALVAIRDLRVEIVNDKHSATYLAQARHLAADRASRAHRIQLEALRPRWVRPTWLPFTSPFGPRWGGFHSGIDFTGPIGTPVFAAGDGWVVTPVGTSGYGNVVAIAHPDGATTWYCHLSQILATGGHVQAGQIIGLVGNTGYVTGPHLHFEVRYNNTPIDPVPWLRGHGVAV